MSERLSREERDRLRKDLADTQRRIEALSSAHRVISRREPPDPWGRIKIEHEMARVEHHAEVVARQLGLV